MFSAGLLAAKGHRPFFYFLPMAQEYYSVALAVCAINILSKATHPDDLVTQVQLAIRNASEIDETRKMASD